MTQVFVDSGGFFAFLAREDSLHSRAAALFRSARDERWKLVTTNAVVFETHALLVNRVRNGRDLGLRFLALMDRTAIESAIAFDRHFKEYGRVRIL